MASGKCWRLVRRVVGGGVMGLEIQILLGAIVAGTGALLSFWAGWDAGWRTRGRQRPPQGSYGLPDHDWRRSFSHENTNRPSGAPPLRLRRSTDGYQPRPQQGTPNPPPREP